MVVAVPVVPKLKPVAGVGVVVLGPNPKLRAAGAAATGLVSVAAFLMTAGAAVAAVVAAAVAVAAAGFGIICGSWVLLEAVCGEEDVSRASFCQDAFFASSYELPGLGFASGLAFGIFSCLVLSTGFGFFNSFLF